MLQMKEGEKAGRKNGQRTREAALSRIVNAAGKLPAASFRVPFGIDLDAAVS